MMVLAVLESPLPLFCVSFKSRATKREGFKRGVFPDLDLSFFFLSFFQ